MKTIVVPVDFSTYSENALKLAARLAKSHNAEIVTVHMLGLSEAQLTKENNSMEGLFFVKLAKQQFAEFLDKDYLQDLTVHEEVLNYAVFSEISKIVAKYEADLIVMASHGSSGLQELFVGSNTEKVVRTSEVPVLVVKDDIQFIKGSGIFACDFSLENIEAFKKAKQFFKLFNLEMDLVYINQPNDYNCTLEIEKKISTFIEELDNYDIKLEDVIIYNDYSVEQGIFNYAQKTDADLIAIPTHGRRGLAHFFSGSISEDIANHSTLPVLTLKI